MRQMLMLDARGSIITPAIGRQMMAKLAQEFDYLDSRYFWAEMHPSQACEWHQCGSMVQSIAPREVGRITMLPECTFLGLPLELNVHLSTSVILIRNNREIVAEIARLGLTNWHAEETHV